MRFTSLFTIGLLGIIIIISSGGSVHVLKTRHDTVKNSINNVR